MHVLTLGVDLSDQVVAASGALSSTSSYQTPHSALPMRPYSKPTRPSPGRPKEPER